MPESNVAAADKAVSGYVREKALKSNIVLKLYVSRTLVNNNA